MSNLRQNDLIINSEEKKINKEDINKAKENSNNKTSVPVGYLPVQLSTQGKLSVPAVLHFRNFNLSEIIELSSIVDEDDRIFTLIKCLNNMVYENIDCKNLHENELTEVLLYIQIMFNGLDLGKYKYYINEDITDSDLLNANENIGEISFTNKELNIINIPDKFKEPIRIKNDSTCYKFRLPRIKDVMYAREYVLEKYKEQKEKYTELEYKIKYNNNKAIKDKLAIDENQIKEYDEYQKNRLKDFTKITIASLIVGKEDKSFSFDEALTEIENNKVSLDFWKNFNNVTKDIKFGIDPEVTFVCPKTKEKISRRFLFQATDFLPDMESKSNSGYAVSFGD